MKLILGDNQFFGINHHDLKKGEEVKNKFQKIESIKEFIDSSINLGMDGFMINSNEKGYDLVKKYSFNPSVEIHYSIPYPHKFASIVAEGGMPSLLSYFIKNSSFITNFTSGLRLILSKDLTHLTRPSVTLEVPDSLPKNSWAYLQNIITDLLIGLGRNDIIYAFINAVRKMGYKPGLITLNPIMLDEILTQNKKDDYEDLIVCYNINSSGFNVFPSLDEVVTYTQSKHDYSLMGMSIFSSGAENIPKSIDFISKQNLDYVVFGTSKLTNLKNNIDMFGT